MLVLMLLMSSNVLLSKSSIQDTTMMLVFVNKTLSKC